MTSEVIESVEESFEHMKASVRSSFARLYTALKARELRTLRQLHAVRRQCETSHTHNSACLRSIRLCFDEESIMLEQITKYGSLHLESINLEGNIFLVEDYIRPDEDHMYSYKCIDELTEDKVSDHGLNIEEEALKQITNTDDCVCSVNLTPEEISKQFRDEPKTEPIPISNECVQKNENKSPSWLVDSPSNCTVMKIDEVDSNSTMNDQNTNEICPSTEESSKINPTEEWLNCIKSQIETEPTQASDVMEHSTIVC